MAGHTTIRRAGGWSIELIHPLYHEGKQIDSIELKPADLSHVIRWGNGSIPSTLALASELTGLPEKLLRCLKYPDVDRFMLALTAIMPEPIRNDYSVGNKPLSTADYDLPKESISDQDDPRFPKVEGAVRPYVPPAYVGPNPSQATKPETDDVENDIPDVMRKVG